MAETKDSKKRNIQFRRNINKIYSSEAEAKNAIEALKTVSANTYYCDGEQIFGRFYDESGTVKTIVAYVYNSGNTVDITYSNISKPQTVDEKTIKEDNNQIIYAVDTIIEDPINVIVPKQVGNLITETIISGGTTVNELLRKILTKTVYPVINPPVASISYTNPWTSTYEVGSIFDTSNVTISANCTSGEYVSEDIDSWVYNQDAGCRITNTITDQNDKVITSGKGKIQTTLPVKQFIGTSLEQLVGEFKTYATYSAAIATPRDSDGKEYESKKISSGISENHVLVYVPECYYKYYIGCVPYETRINDLDNEIIHNLNINTGWTSNNGETRIISSVTTTNEKPNIVIAFPYTHELISISNSMGGKYNINDLKSNQTIINNVQIGGNSSTSYQVYELYCNQSIQYKDIIIK